MPDPDLSNDREVGRLPLLPNEFIAPFLMVTLLFPLWGFANDVTNPLVRAFKDIFQISNAESSLVQFAFYFGYGVMALPAAIFIRRVSYRAGVVVGLLLYAVGAFLFLPASYFAQFNYFLVALWVMTCGLAFLEVTANPYILSMGPEETAPQRLNLAQSFNPLGSLTGMIVASSLILNNLETEKFRASERAANADYASMLPSAVDAELNTKLVSLAADDPARFATMQAADLVTVRGPYLAIGCVVLVLLFVFAFTRLPRTVVDSEKLRTIDLLSAFLRLFGSFRFSGGVIAQAFYVGAQIMVWTFVIHYGMTTVGLSASQAQNVNIAAMVLFLLSRFVGTGLLRILLPGRLLLFAAMGGLAATLGAIFLGGWAGLICVVSISVFMAPMFPTIYGIALSGLGERASLASAGLVMAIVGGALMPPLQASLIDGAPILPGINSVQGSFVLPAVCFIIIAAYGLWVSRSSTNSS